MELTLDQALQKGVEAHKAGNVQEADRYYTAILKANPKHSDANHNMGILAVGVGKVEAALPFFKTALEANPKISQFWLSYIDALIKLDRMDDARAILGQAKSSGIKGDGFDQLEQKLNISVVEVKNQIKENTQTHPNILDELKLDQALKLANKKIKDGNNGEAQQIYQDILEKFPKNKKAKDGIKALSSAVTTKNPKLQDPPQDRLQPLLNLYTQGQHQAALNQALQLLLEYPDSVTLYNILGAANQGLGKLDEAIEAYTKAISIKPDFAEGYNNRGNILKEQGKLEEAIEAFERAILLKPNYATAYSNMGNVFKAQARFEEALDVFKKALSINPDFADAYNNMGNVLQDQGNLEKAIEAYKKAIELKPNLAEPYNNIGVILEKQGKLEEALSNFNKALSIEPNYVDAHNNIGVTLKEQKKFEEATEAFDKAILLNPNYAKAYSNMGNVFREQARFEEALDVFKKALSINPDFVECYNNIGNVLFYKGKFIEAIDTFCKAINLKPDNGEFWNNLVFPLQALKINASSAKEISSYYPKNIDSKDAKIFKSILHYNLTRGGQDQGSNLEEVIRLLAESSNLIIQNQTKNNIGGTPNPALPHKMVALVHFGRSGTGLLHSLVDNHPEVSTLPSIYFSEYFNESTWQKIISGGWGGMVDCFVAMYDVLFDATSSVPVGSKGKKLFYNIGVKEGMTTVGKERNEILSVDKSIFKKELNQLLSSYSEIDLFVFFKLVHVAHVKAIKNPYNKNLIFYHIHNPDTYAMLNFSRYAPEASWIMMIREPVQSCESWVRKSYSKNDYFTMVSRISTMLFETDNVFYSRHRSVGVRLEDLKEQPHKTIPALCKWMSIEEDQSLYEMTAQGKRWWGDPVSPDYEKDGMQPFGKTSINRKVGTVFSKNDMFIIGTLFYPFSVRFGYVQENQEKFNADLQTIRPLLDGMFDFEKNIAKRTEVDPGEFMKLGSYSYFRASLIERWNTLNTFNTYPNMIPSLEIS